MNVEKGTGMTSESRMASESRMTSETTTTPGPVGEESARCRRCRTEGGEDLITENLITENLITRRAPDGDSELTYCADCIRALGLDWCCRCYRWRPADQIDPETEACRECTDFRGTETVRGTETRE